MSKTWHLLTWIVLLQPQKDTAKLFHGTACHLLLSILNFNEHQLLCKTLILGVLFTVRTIVIFLNYKVNCLGPSENKCISLMWFLFYSYLFNSKYWKIFLCVIIIVSYFLDTVKTSYNVSSKIWVFIKSLVALTNFCLSYSCPSFLKYASIALSFNGD